MNSPIRVASVPGAAESENPYLSLLYNALAMHGVAYAGGVSPRQMAGVDALEFSDWIHIHWPEHAISRTQPKAISALKSQVPGMWRFNFDRIPGYGYLQSRQFRAFVGRCQRRGARVAWTVHNLTPHDGRASHAVAVYRWLAKEVDLCVFHDRAALEQFKECYGEPRKSLVCPHGNYVSAFPPSASSSSTREKLGIRSDVILLGLIGQIRPYKNLEAVLDFAESTDSNIIFLIAGSFETHPDRQQLIRRCECLPNVVLVAKALTDQEYADCAAACDGILLLYAHATTSGALMSALTFGKGVITSNLPAFTGVLKLRPDAGVIVEEKDISALKAALGSFVRDIDGRSQAAKDLADEFSWDRIVAPLAQALNLKTDHR